MTNDFNQSPILAVFVARAACDAKLKGVMG